jgi:hypothetical protein
VLLGRLRVGPERRVVRFFIEPLYLPEFAGIVKAAPEAFAGDR